MKTKKIKEWTGVAEKKEGRLDWEKFKFHFDQSWWPKMKPWIESKECYEIYQKLKSSNEQIFPLSQHVWKAFRWTNYNKLKAIWVGQCPYHTHERGVPYADGLAFSCGLVGRESPSLEVLYDAMRDDLDVRMDRVPDLNYLAMQDVLLLNASLTTKKGVADSDGILWQPFMEYLWKNILDTVTGVPIVLFGQVAKDNVLEHLSNNQPYKYVKHPAYYARKGGLMEHDGLFSWCNEIVKANNGEKIYWNHKDYINECLPF